MTPVRTRASASGRRGDGLFVLLALRGQPAGVLDRDWAQAGVTAPTAAERIAAAAETCLLITRMTNWDLDAYQNWLAATLTRLSRPITGDAPADQRES